MIQPALFIAPAPPKRSSGCRHCGQKQCFGVCAQSEQGKPKLLYGPASEPEAVGYAAVWQALYPLLQVRTVQLGGISKQLATRC